MTDNKHTSAPTPTGGHGRNKHKNGKMIEGKVLQAMPV